LARTLTLLFTLALLFGVAFLSVMAYPSDAPEDRLTVLMGFVLLAASVAGSLARTVGLPKITGFLVIGILAGPSMSGLIPWGALDKLRLIDSFALALIALLAGGELKVRALRPAAKSIAFTTMAVVGVVWIGMTLVFLPIGFFLPFLDGAGFLGILALGALLGIWAANSSPDLTVAVIEETGSKGPLTDVILGVTIVKDVVVIVLFTLVLALVRPILGAGGGEEGMLLRLLWEVGGALAVGGGLGWTFSIYLEQERIQPAYVTFLFAYVLVLVADFLHVELLLVGVAAGFTIENMSEAGDEMIHSIEKVSVVIFAFFFTIAGASLDLDAIETFWIAALILFLARVGLTYWGARLGTRWAGASPEIQVWSWRGLMSQGGVTLGLLLLIQEALPEIGGGVVALGMAVIIGNILGGPILLKTALSRPKGSAVPGAGEKTP
jgi:Kef-type K+ transport system membrane component KefB